MDTVSKKWVVLSAAVLLSVMSGFVQAETRAADAFGWRYNTFKDGTAEICSGPGYEELSGALTIPSSVDGYPVTAIGVYAFMNCSNLTSVVIPDSVTNIGDSAFEHCTGLTRVTLPKGLESIGEAAFGSCAKLRSMAIPSSVKSMGRCMFECCDQLDYVMFMGAPPRSAGSLYTNAKGYYRADYATQWEAVLDDWGTWSEMVMQVIAEAFPEAKTDEEIAAAFEGSRDARLEANMTSAAEYEKFRSWVGKISEDDYMVRQKVKDSELAWFASALDLSVLPEEAPTNVVIGMIGSAAEGALDLEVSVGDLKVGEGATAADLGTVFSVEGAADLKDKSFVPYSGNVTMSAAEDGKLAIQVTPPEGQKQFFIRVKMTP